MSILKAEKLSAEAFKPYGDVIELAGHESISINNNNCQRYSDLANLDIDPSGTPGISLFDAKAYPTPVELKYVERHPLGSQAFLPTSRDPYLIIVANDLNNTPQLPRVFISDGFQGVNYHRNTWHGVLTPIVKQSLFVVVDYIGEGENLEEHWFEEPFSIDATNAEAL